MGLTGDIAVEVEFVGRIQMGLRYARPLGVHCSAMKRWALEFGSRSIILLILILEKAYKHARAVDNVC